MSRNNDTKLALAALKHAVRTRRGRTHGLVHHTDRGSPYASDDYRATIRRLVAALAPIHPRLGGAPPELPFFWVDRTLRNGLNFPLVTDEGDIDALGEVTGLGNYNDLALRAIEIDVYGACVRVLSLEDLIRSKAAAGRAKDLVDLEALRALADKK